MATTSGALAPGKAPAGHGNNHPGRWAAALAAAALGLALLIGGILAQGRPAAEPAAAPVASSIPAAAGRLDQHGVPLGRRALPRPLTHRKEAAARVRGATADPGRGPVAHCRFAQPVQACFPPTAAGHDQRGEPV